MCWLANAVNIARSPFRPRWSCAQSRSSAIRTDSAGNAYVAGVLESADDAAVPEDRARRVAAEHHVWVATASFAGSTGGGYAEAAGGSGIWDPDGVAVARAGTETGEVVRATLS